MKKSEHNIYITDKLIILNKAKIASSITDCYFRGNKGTLPINKNVVNFGFNSKDGIYIADFTNEFQDNQKIHSYRLKEIQKMLDGKSKQKIYYLYREPVTKFISGVYQEFMGKITDYTILPFWLKKYKNGNEMLNYIQLISRNNHEKNNQYFNDINQNRELNKSFRDMAEDYVDYVIEQQGFISGHTSPSLFFIPYLLNYSNILKNDISFIDIDEVDVEEEVMLKHFKKVNNCYENLRNEDGKINRDKWRVGPWKSLISDACNEKLRTKHWENFIDGELLGYEVLKKMQKDLDI